MDNQIDDLNLKENFEIGIIGGGDMGQLYATKFRDNGFKRISLCDLPNNFEKLKLKYPDGCGINLLDNGFSIVRLCDFILYCVEAENLDKVVKLYGPATKIGAIVGGQTSVKAPEIDAFDKYLPKDTKIITCHSMHGPNIDPKGQPLAIIEYRNNEIDLLKVKSVLNSLESKMIYLDYQEHDRITANTQAVTHLAFISMGTTWMDRGFFPWESDCYVGGIENAKVNIMLRIFSNKWHVYAGLALLNPSAKEQILTYCQSVKELFELMIEENEKEFKERIYKAGKYIFKSRFMNDLKPTNLLLSDSILDQFSLSLNPKLPSVSNSHLSLLAMVDSWYKLKIDPYDHIVCQTPPFRTWLGIVEFLFTSSQLMEECIDTALYCKRIRLDDLSFFSSTQSWGQVVELQSFNAYQSKFIKTQSYFQPRLHDGAKLAADMLHKIMVNTNN